MPKEWEKRWSEYIIKFIQTETAKEVLKAFISQTIRSEIERCVKFIADANRETSEFVEIGGDEWLNENYPK
jgi:hypothetical protein